MCLEADESYLMNRLLPLWAPQSPSYVHRVSKGMDGTSIPQQSLGGLLGLWQGLSSLRRTESSWHKYWAWE